MVNGDALGEKQIDVSVMRRSVIDRPPADGASIPSYESSIFWFAAAFSDEFLAWGKNPQQRDRQLREFITQENIFASALGTICNRNAAFHWVLDGPERTVAAIQSKLESANLGEGWEDLIIKVSIDLYTQDKGAFVEIVRESNNSPESPFLGLNHLDAGRCFHTGAPEAPVIYIDRLGRWHLLKWWQVVTLAEMPTPIEGLYGLQYCVLSRLLRAAQILRSINIRNYEKLSGRFSKAIHLVKGVTAQQVTDAINSARATADAAGLMRYMDPVLVGTLDPKADVGHDTIELASLPDGYSEETMLKWYVAWIALAFGSDYQEFAPLPGGNLGTSSQSEVLHMKTRGKGPAMFMKLISNMLNFRVLPQNVSFRYDEQDVEADKAEAEVKQLRAETRKTRIESGEITIEIAQQIAQDEGDLTQEQRDQMSETPDLSPDVTVEEETTAEMQTADVSQQNQTVQLEQEQKTQDDRAGPEERKEVEQKVATIIERGFNRMRAKIDARLKEEFAE